MPACLAFFFIIAPLSALAQGLTVSPENDELRDRLRSEILVLDSERDASTGDVIAAAKGDYPRILAVLYEEGYFSAAVSIRLAGREASGLASFDAPADLRPIEIVVDTGPRFRFGDAVIAPGARKATEVPGFETGEPAGTAIIQEAAAVAIEDWRRNSHAKAQITGQSITARHDAARLDVVLSVDPGPPLTFGELLITGGDTVRPERLQQIAGLPTGDDFDPEELRRTRQRLVNTGVFSTVVLREADDPSADGSLEILARVDPSPPRRIGFGAEIESTDGLSLQGFWLHRNIFGGAERLRFDAEVEGIGGTTGGIDYRLASTLRVPGFRQANDTLELSAALERLDEPNFEENLLEFGVRGERQVNDTTIIGTGLGLRFSDVSDAFGERQFNHLTATLDGQRDRRDSALNPRAGAYYFLELLPFFGLSGSATGFRLEGDVRGYLPLGDRTSLGARIQFGSILGTEIDETPPDFLFFSGGGGTVRGQGFQSLGVEGANGTTGGRGFGGFSFEARQDITEALGAVAFIDYGFISPSGQFGSGSDHAGAGLGIRYNTPFGPLRVDVGVPVGESSDGTSYGIYIGLGQAF